MSESETAKSTARNQVRSAYAQVAAAETAAGCCGTPAPAEADKTEAVGCCSPNAVASTRVGYTDADLAALPDGADLGLGCGNPVAIARLKPGEVVVDLGAGGGIDCFLAADRVGPRGRVIGIDMTPEMLAKARANAARAGHANVEFRLGEIEHLPVADATADAILSNCVVNLSPDKPQVFREAFRALKPGGRLCISDVLALRPLPESMRSDPALLCGCIGGAATAAEVEEALAAAGFTAVAVEIDPRSAAFIADWAPGTGAENYVASARIEAIKPR